MNRIQWWATSDNFQRIVACLIGIFLLITLSMMKKGLNCLQKQRQSVQNFILKASNNLSSENDEIFSNKHQLYLGIIRKYFICNFCLKFQKQKDYYLNFLCIFAIFMITYAIKASQALLQRRITQIQNKQHIPDDYTKALQYYLVDSLCSIWIVFVIVPIDCFIRNSIQQSLDQYLILQKNQIPQNLIENNIKINKRYQIYAIYIYALNFLSIGCLLYIKFTIQELPHHINFTNLNFSKIINHKAANMLVSIPIIMLFYQLEIIIIAAICYLVKLLKQQNKILNQKTLQNKITTTMNIFGDQSNENMQAGLQNNIFNNNNECISVQFNDIKDQGLFKYQGSFLRVANKFQQCRKSNVSQSLNQKILYQTNYIRNKNNRNNNQIKYPLSVKQIHKKQNPVFQQNQVHCFYSSTNKSNIFDLPDQPQISQISPNEFQQIPNVMNNQLKLKVRPLQNSSKKEPNVQKISQYNKQNSICDDSDYKITNLGSISEEFQPKLTINHRQKKSSLDYKYNKPSLVQSTNTQSLRSSMYRRRKKSIGPILNESPVKHYNQYCLQQIKQAYLKQ